MTEMFHIMELRVDFICFFGLPRRDAVNGG